MKLLSRAPAPALSLVSMLVLAGAAAAPTPALADTYPSRPITVIVPLVAGGGPDTLARILAERMKATLGQPLVVENIPTAAGTVGVARLARSAPDGYTIGIGDQTTNLVSSLTNQVQYDVVNDFEPVALLTTSPVALIGRKDLPPADVKQLIAWLRETPDRATAGTFGQGSGPHILMSGFQSMTGTKLRLVAYRGTPPALQDIVGGQIDLLFVEQSNMIGSLRSGTIKAFGVSGSARSAALPQVPTIAEAGGPAFDVRTWRAMWTPKGAPPSVLKRLGDAVVEALADPGVRKQIEQTSQEIVPPDQQTPRALAAHHRAEIEKWLPMIKAASTAVGTHATSPDGAAAK